jgi:hypothetical protein
MILSVMRIYAPVADPIPTAYPSRRRVIDRQRRAIVLSGAFAVLCFWAWLFPHTGDGDAILHYLSARDALAWPKGFLSPWARWGALWPIVLPAQWGILPARCVMAAISTLCIWQTMRMADDLRLRPAALAGVFVLLQPLVFPLAADAMTELPTALLLVVAVRLWWSGRYSVSCLVVSFLPAVRPEGFIILPLWLGMLAAGLRSRRARVLAAALLFTGLFAWTLMDWLVVRDPLYIITSWNWPVQSYPAYGHGTIWHHVVRWPIYCGPVLFPLFLLGIWPSVRSAMQDFPALCRFPAMHRLIAPSPRPPDVSSPSRRSAFSRTIASGNRRGPTMLLPVTLWLIFFLLHTILYWRGLFASVGLMRIFASTSPFTALICAHGWIVARRWLSNRWSIEKPSSRQRLNGHVLSRDVLTRGALTRTILARCALVAGCASVVFYYIDNPEHFRYRPLADATGYIRQNHLLDRAPAVFLGDPIAIADLDLPPRPTVMLNSCTIFEQRKRLRHLPPGAIGIWDNQHARQWFNLSVEDVQQLGFKILYESQQDRRSLILYRTAKSDGLQRYAVMEKTSPVE